MEFDDAVLLDVPFFAPAEGVGLGEEGAGLGDGGEGGGFAFLGGWVDAEDEEFVALGFGEFESEAAL